jgi:hypothetical protein
MAFVSKDCIEISLPDIQLTLQRPFRIFTHSWQRLRAPHDTKKVAQRFDMGKIDPHLPWQQDGLIRPGAAIRIGKPNRRINNLLRRFRNRHHTDALDTRQPGITLEISTQIGDIEKILCHGLARIMENSRILAF